MTKYLPAGAMRARQWVGRLEGFAAAMLLMLLIKVLTFALEPAEIARPIRATVEPVRGPIEPLPSRLAIEPCVGQGKDCMAVEYHNIPEPGTIYLLIGGLIAVVLLRKKKK